MFGRIITLAGLAAAIALGLLVQSTNPATTGPVGILAVFFCVYVILLSCFTWAIYGSNFVLTELLKVSLRKKTVVAMTMQKAYYFASVVALGPIILLAMNSVGSMGVYDIMLIIIFVVIGVFYIQKRG